MHSRGGNWEVMRVSQSLRRWMARHCEVVTSLVWRFSVGQRTVLRNGDQVISQHWFHCGTGKQSVYCIEKESASALFSSFVFCICISCKPGDQILSQLCCMCCIQLIYSSI